MQTETKATLADLYRVPENGKAELVGGKLIRMSPTGGLPGYAAAEIYASLRDYARHTKLGYAIGDNVGFIVDLPNRRSFSPDAAFYTGELTMKFLEGAPLFAVEVRSEGDYGPAAERAMATKRADYFAASTEAVWDVDLLEEPAVRLYRAEAPETAVAFRRGEAAHAEPALSGWRMPVENLFPTP